eukprot:4988128-Pleurochrysis_carterae.AAC.1
MLSLTSLVSRICHGDSLYLTYCASGRRRRVLASSSALGAYSRPGAMPRRSEMMQNCRNSTIRRCTEYLPSVRALSDAHACEIQFSASDGESTDRAQFMTMEKKPLNEASLLEVHAYYTSKQAVTQRAPSSHCCTPHDARGESSAQQTEGRHFSTNKVAHPFSLVFSRRAL